MSMRCAHALIAEQAKILSPGQLCCRYPQALTALSQHGLKRGHLLGSQLLAGSLDALPLGGKQASPSAQQDSYAGQMRGLQLPGPARQQSVQQRLEHSLVVQSSGTCEPPPVALARSLEM